MPFITVFGQVLGREKQVKIVNEVKQLVRERINSGAVEGHDRSPKPVLDKELGRKKQVKIAGVNKIPKNHYPSLAKLRYLSPKS